MIDGKVNRQKNPNEKGEKRQKKFKLGMRKRDKTTECHYRGPLIGSQYN